MENDMTNDQVADYVNEYYFSSHICHLENHILELYKFRFDKFPTEKNEKEWLDYSNFICNRRGC